MLSKKTLGVVRMDIYTKKQFTVYNYDNGAWNERYIIRDISTIQACKILKSGNTDGEMLISEGHNVTFVKVNGKVKVVFLNNTIPAYSQACRIANRSKKDVEWRMFPFQDTGICFKLKGVDCTC